jgi:hypothetical protein
MGVSAYEKRKGVGGENSTFLFSYIQSDIQIKLLD